MVTTSFTQVATSSYDGISAYLWSNGSNWTNGIPLPGEDVVSSSTGAASPPAIDDIGSLSIDTLTMNRGTILVAGTLSVSTLIASGLLSPTIEADSLQLGAHPLLIVNSVSSSAEATAGVGAVGLNAEAEILGQQDGGGAYFVNDGGTLLLSPVPNGSGHSTFSFSQSTTGTPVSFAGVIAFENPGSVVTDRLYLYAESQAIELPGTYVQSVDIAITGSTAGSLAIQTSAGLTTFENISFNSTLVPDDFSVTTDAATGLERILISADPDFTPAVTQSGTYDWSSSQNWIDGTVTNNGRVVYNQDVVSTDDISTLTLSELTMDQGTVLVPGILTVETLVPNLLGTESGEIVSDSLGQPGSTLDVQSFGNDGLSYTVDEDIIGSEGIGAVADIQAATDPGEIYFADAGGEVIVAATPNAASAFVFHNSNTGEVSTIAFKNPSGTIASSRIGVNDAFELPGTVVTAFSESGGKVTIATNLGTTVFAEVNPTGLPNGYVAQFDGSTGLEKIIFTNSVTSTFTQSVEGAGIGVQTYLWSASKNWIGGVPTNGDDVVFNAGTTTDPDAQDDIGTLFLDTLTMPQGFLQVTGTLEVGQLNLGATGDGAIGSYFNNGESNSNAELIIDSLGTASSQAIKAVGFAAATYVRAPTDPGETYIVDLGGTVVLSAVPNSASLFSFGDHDAADYVSTIGFENPSSVIASALLGVEGGDAIELPGTAVSSLTLGTKSMTIVTNVGTVSFTDVAYQNGGKPTEYVTSTDRSTGLESVLFFDVVNTFTQGVESSYAGGLNYLWSNQSNWSSGTPLNGADIVYNEGTALPIDSYDDISSLQLATLSLDEGYLAVTGTLEVTDLAMSPGVPGNIYADTLPGNGSAALIIDALNGGSSILIGAKGVGAVTMVKAATDPGDQYSVDQGGTLIMSAVPNAQSAFAFGDKNTSVVSVLAFKKTAATIASDLLGVEAGDAIEVPGTAVTSVTFGSGSLTITTNLGTTVFSDVSYASKPAGYAAAKDPSTGLEEVTFECFLPGTPIATPAGDVAVERLRVGDAVVTRDGASRPIVWIGRRSVDCRQLADPSVAWPVVVRAHAFGRNEPRQDIYLSLDHAVYVAGRLIPVRRLINGASIALVPMERVEYYHIELETHDVIQAAGLMVESYLDTGNRGNFRSSAWAVLVRPDRGRLEGQAMRASVSAFPLVVSNQQAHWFWHIFADRARRSGYALPDVTAMTRDPALMLWVDGMVVQPVRQTPTEAVFRLSAGAGRVRLLSRAGRPTDRAPWSDDRRVLGVAVTRIEVSNGMRRRAVSIDQPEFEAGWHPVERDEVRCWRWTNGDAEVPVALFRRYHGTVTLRLRLFSEMWFFEAEAGPIACAA